MYYIQMFSKAQYIQLINYAIKYHHKKSLAKCSENIRGVIFTNIHDNWTIIKWKINPTPEQA